MYTVFYVRNTYNKKKKTIWFSVYLNICELVVFMNRVQHM